MRWRIRSQLLLPLLLLLVGVVGMSVWMAFAAVNLARQQIETRVRDVAKIVSAGKFPLAQQHVLVWVKQLSGADYLLVRQQGGRISTLEVEPDRLPPLEEVGEDWRELRLGPPLRAGENVYLCSSIRLLRGDNAGDILYILYPEKLWRDAFWQAIWPFLLMGGSVGAASVVLALSLGQGLSRRIVGLERQTRRIAGGDFRPVPLPQRNDEIRDLAQSINDMAARLAQFQETTQRSERLRLLGQVGGGLAHQLRNGLAGVRLAVQLYMSEGAELTDTSALDVALRQLKLLETNLKRFLDLGRDGEDRRERCSLPALVHEAVELLRPQCRHTGIDLRWQRPGEERLIVGDAAKLSQLILNVLGNAVEAAGPGGVVEATIMEESRLVSQSSLVVLEVRDSGPGPNLEVADRLFEPFVTGKPDGVGLGLAVARQVAEWHGGCIHWIRQDGWTLFRIELPQAGCVREQS